ncbi:MAG: hypothetical protein IBX64_08320 [Actinobacteria bacterium]|nr:hypothetical protein [Actinomycetota bacterium]
MMDILNRVLLIVIFTLVALASLAGLLLAIGAITPGQLQAVIPYQQVVNFFTANFVAASLISIFLLAIVLALGIFWLRGQFAGAVTAVVGGQYETRAKAPGTTTISYDVVEKAIDNTISGITGVIESQTRIFSERDGQLFARSNLTVKRSADIHSIDNKIRESINREWLDKLGSNLASHDIIISLEPVEPRVA